jgi:hypothetical protein
MSPVTNRPVAPNSHLANIFKFFGGHDFTPVLETEDKLIPLI